MNFNLNTLSTNYVSSQFSLNKLLNQNNTSTNSNSMCPGSGVAVGQNANLAPRFLAMNNGPANQPNNGNSNPLVNLGLASQPQAMNHCGTGAGGPNNSNGMYRNSYGLSSTAASSASSSTSSSLSSSLTNLNYAASAANSLNAAAQNLSNQLSLNAASAAVGNNNGAALNSAPGAGVGNSSASSLIASVVAAAAAENNSYNNLLANSSLPHMQSTTCSLNNTLFVGNLHASLQEIDLIQVFRPFGHIVECCKKWLHFGFVKFTTEEEACHAYVTLNGFRLKGRPMRLEFQNRTKKARIKAILAQAALQSVTSANGFRNDSLESSLASLNFSNYFPDERQQQHHMQQQHYNQNQQYQQHQQHQQQHMSNYMQGGGGGNNNNCLFSNATTNSLIESLYKSVESSSTCPPNFAAGPFENSFFNPEQLIKFASNLDAGGQKEQQQSNSNCYSAGASKSHLDFNNLDFFGSTCNRVNGGPFDFGTLDKEKQIRNNLNSIINDKDTTNDCGGGLLKPVSQGSSMKSSSTQQLNEESLFLHFQMKRTQLSPAISPQHDTSSSLSSDSGCRSTSFLNDEDSGLSSINSIAKVMANHLLAVPGQQVAGAQSSDKTTKLSMLDDCTLSEHLEFTTCSNSSPVKLSQSQATSDQMVANVLELENCIKININDLEVNDLLDVDEACGNKNNNSSSDADNHHQQGNDDNDDDDDLESNTSNDASEMPNDADCLNDLEGIDEHFLINSACANAPADVVAGEYSSSSGEHQSQSNYNQVVEKDGSLSQMTY